MFFRKKKRSAEEAAPVGPVSGSSSRGPERESGDEPSSTQFLTGDAVRDRRWVDSLLDEVARVSDRVARVRGPEDLRELLTYIVDASLERTGAERGLLVLAGTSAGGQGGPGSHEIHVARQRGGKAIEGEVRYSTSAVKRVLETGVAMKDMFNSAAEAMDLGASVFDLKLRALMCVPLDTSSEDDEDRANRRGVLYVDSKAATREFTQQDLSYFTALSRQIATALRTARLHIDSLERARLEQSLETARIVQSNLMPQIPGDYTGFDLFGWYQAAERTSGDFYDFFKTRGGKLAVVVGDVTGHGPASALITSTAQAFLRSTLRVIDDPCQALSMLNQDLAERMETGLFVTLFLALLDQSGSVQIFNIGHAPPMVWRSADGSIESISGHGPALGMIAEFEYTESSTIVLEKGDILMAFTDGLSEARPKDDPDALFGEEGLQEVVRQVGPTAKSARVVGEKIVQAVLAHARDNREDDLTIVVVQRNGA